MSKKEKQTVVKPFLTYNEQLELLESRGVHMFFDEKEFYIYYLINNSYYTMINSTNIFFKEAGNDKYKDETYMIQIETVAQFDKKLKYLLLPLLLDFEKSFNSILSYSFCFDKRTEVNPYLNRSNFYLGKNKQYKSKANKLCSLMKRRYKEYEESKKIKSLPIRHYIEKYKQVPLWVLTDNFYFSISEDFYSSMKKEDKLFMLKEWYKVINFNLYRKKSDQEWKFNMFQLETYCKSFRKLRNTIAHNSTLYYFNSPELPFNKYIYHRQVLYGQKFNNTRVRTKIYDIIIALELFTDEREYEVFLKNLTKEIFHVEMVLGKLDSLRMFMDNLGFPIDWHSKVNDYYVAKELAFHEIGKGESIWL